MLVEHHPEITQGLVKLFFAGYQLGNVELAANLTAGIEQCHLMAAFCSHRGKRQPGRAGTHDRDRLGRSGLHIGQFGFVTGAGIDQTRCQLAAEGVIKTGLVAADTGVDLISAVLGCLQNQVGICEERPGHGHHIGITLGQNLFGHVRHVDPVGGDQWNAHLPFQARRHLGKGPAGNRRGNGGHPGLVPADAGVDNGRTRLLDFLGQVHNLFPGAAILNQIQHGQTVDQDEVLSHPFTNPTDDFDRQANPVFVAATPTVGAVVGVGNNELVDEIAFRTHDLNAIITGSLRQCGAIRVVLDLLFNTCFIQLPGLEWVDRCLDGGRRYQLRRVGITASMENLHADLAIGCMDGVGDNPVLVGLLFGGHLGGVLEHPSFHVRGNTASHDQTSATAGTLGIECSKTFEAIFGLLQPRMHGSHQGAIAQLGKTKIQRLEQVRVFGNAWRRGRGHSRSPHRDLCRGSPKARAPFIVEP